MDPNIKYWLKFAVLFWLAKATYGSRPNINEAAKSAVRVYMGKYRDFQYSCEVGQFASPTGRCEPCMSICEEPTKMCSSECPVTYVENFVVKPALNRQKTSHDQQIEQLKVLVYAFGGIAVFSVVFVVCTIVSVSVTRRRDARLNLSTSSLIKPSDVESAEPMLSNLSLTSQNSSRHDETVNDPNVDTVCHPAENTENHDEQDKRPWVGVSPAEDQSTEASYPGPRPNRSHENNRNEHGNTADGNGSTTAKSIAHASLTD